MSDLISKEALLESLEKEQEIYENNGAIPSFWTALSVVRHVPTVKTEPQWILCSERLPDKEYELYWTTHEDGSIVLHGYTKKNGFIYNWEVDDLELRKRQGGVVAWMLIPQPEPYKGE